MNGGTPPTLAARTRVARYLLACAVVAGAVAMLVLGGPRVCREELADAAARAVRVCGPPGVADLATLAPAAFVLLLLAPDLGEAGIGGVTLKRRVEEAKADAATARADAAAVRLAVTNLRQEVDVSVSAQANTWVDNGSAELLKALADLGLLRDAADQAESAGTAPSVEQAARALLLSEGVERVRSFLPEEWQDATFVAVVGDVTLVGGAEITAPTVDRLLRDADGAVARARRGEYAVSPSTGRRPAVVAAPVWQPGGAQVAVVAVVLPPGTAVDDTDAYDLAAPAAMLATIVSRPRRGTGTHGGPQVREEAR